MLVNAVNLISTWTFMNIKGPGHSLTFVQGHWDSTFLIFFSSKNTRLIEAKFHIEPPRDIGMKIYSKFRVTWQDGFQAHTR